MKGAKSNERGKVTIPYLQRKKEAGRKITMLTAYDYSLAKMIDTVGMDMILVGDSLGMVLLGYDSTAPVTMENMLHHAKAVNRAVEYAFVVGDMPFLSYVREGSAIRNAGRLVQEAGCDAVKIEGGREVLSSARAIVNAGIPVMGHLGLTPQTATKLGGFKVQGETAETAQKIADDARALEEAGCFSIVLECVPRELAGIVTEQAGIPILGIGAGLSCDGQVLVTYDLLGLSEYTPKFVKQYTNLKEPTFQALEAYRQDVGSESFPGTEHTFSMKPGELEKLLVKL